MSEWLEGILDALDKPFDEKGVDPPLDKVGENEHVVGTLGEMGRILYRLTVQARIRTIKIVQEFRRACVETLVNRNTAEVERLKPLANLANHQQQALDELLWTEVMTQFPECADYAVDCGIRENWQVTCWPKLSE